MPRPTLVTRLAARETLLRKGLRATALALATTLVTALPVSAVAATPKREAQSRPSLASTISSPARAGVLLTPPAPRGGRSVGSPTDGHLVGGSHLDETPWLRVVPCYKPGEPQWGLESLTWTIDHAGRAVRKEFPDSVLSVGHLSRQNGGEIDRHASHESGRDADIGFYVVDQRGKPIYADHFVAFKADGTAPSWPGAKFDDARNWAFVASVLGQDRARVSYMFVASPLRARLLAYAQKIGAPYSIRLLAAERMAQPHGSLPHDDHFHMRISCPGGMEGCVEFPTRNVARMTRHAAGRARMHEERPRAAEPTPASPAREVSPPAAPSTPVRPVAHPNTAPEIHDPPADPPAMLDTPIDDVDGVEVE